jgi:hypothetical protein
MEQHSAKNPEKTEETLRETLHDSVKGRKGHHYSDHACSAQTKRKTNTRLLGKYSMIPSDGPKPRIKRFLKASSQKMMTSSHFIQTPKALL